jgi:hypothetical protein
MLGQAKLFISKEWRSEAAEMQFHAFLISTADAGESWPVHNLQKSSVSNDLEVVWHSEPDCSPLRKDKFFPLTGFETRLLFRPARYYTDYIIPARTGIQYKDNIKIDCKAVPYGRMELNAFV